LRDNVSILAAFATDHGEANLMDRSACLASRSKIETYGSSE
jgi:hypothetical protein